MDYHKNSNGWQTFVEHWGLVIILAVAMITSQALMVLSNLSAAQWVLAFRTCFLLMAVGTVFIGYAKLPSYRSGNWLSFGAQSLPKHLTGFYLWGWRIFTFGVVIAIFLYLSRLHTFIAS